MPTFDARNSSGNPLIAGVGTEAGLEPNNTGFTLKLYDLDNNPVTSNATVRWPAIIPDSDGEAQVKWEWLLNI
ncbi:hypothetical protein DCCM_0272 [Desulfocucumis palustris]|uniref:Uncharacterized protein n=1 Tax=Desulfocucumis palustris TaxID=1898651 RepID=A0A2L2XE24_9FIRM|nr:hypothetical protein DCCM_0272 [Desulfocucumis palustris]